jgi:hypothetical protein
MVSRTLYKHNLNGLALYSCDLAELKSVLDVSDEQGNTCGLICIFRFHWAIGR